MDLHRTVEGRWGRGEVSGEEGWKALKYGSTERRTSEAAALLPGAPSGGRNPLLLCVHTG